MKHRFHRDPNHGWGWPRFMLLSELHDPAKGYLVDNACIIRFEVTCRLKEGSDDDENVKESALPHKVPEVKRRKIKDERH
ncbi:hypothetical protein MKX03_012203, partial [Papaver bracteatum]